jgi:thiamine biosynthesis protein ThiS
MVGRLSEPTSACEADPPRAEPSELMEILLNGERREIEGEPSVAALLDSLQIQSRRVAVMIDDEVVKKEAFADRRLREGERVEIVQMVGGG